MTLEQYKYTSICTELALLSHSHTHDPSSPHSYPTYAFGTAASWLNYAIVSPFILYLS